MSIPCFTVNHKLLISLGKAVSILLENFQRSSSFEQCFARTWCHTTTPPSVHYRHFDSTEEEAFPGFCAAQHSRLTLIDAPLYLAQPERSVPFTVKLIEHFSLTPFQHLLIPLTNLHHSVILFLLCGFLIQNFIKDNKIPLCGCFLQSRVSKCWVL